MAIPREIIEEILYRTDIESLIGSYVSLKRSGSNLFGLCPFHSERSPSFSVSPSKKMFYCCGCGAGGDAITFVMKAENLDYVEAIEFLASKVGITIPQDGKVEMGMSRKRVFDMNREAARFFRDCLFNPKYGTEGLRYLTEKRGLSPAFIKHFGLGFSPNDFGMLTDHMKRLGYTEDELVMGFLCGKSQKTGRPYDYFRNRVMFPIIDVTGNVIAFGGRVMDDSKPKYLNSSDTPGFKKSKNLFALNYAKNHCEESLILCEGYMDVITLHAAGFENAVATLGTALTAEQARIMTKYTKKVLISYDSDDAGQRAADRAIRILGDVGLDVRILKLPDAKDPDEFIKKFGAERLRSVLNESKTWFDYKADAVFAKHDLTTTGGRLKASEEICAIIATSPSQIEREVYITQTAPKLGLTVDVMRNNVGRLMNKMKTAEQAKNLNTIKMSIQNYGDRVNPDAVKNVTANACEEGILGMLLLYEEHRAAVASGKISLSAEDFFTDLGRRIFEAIMKLQRSDGGFLFSLLGEIFTPDEMGRIGRMIHARESLSDNGTRVFREHIERLREATNSSKKTTNLDDLLRAKRERLTLQKKPTDRS